MNNHNFLKTKNYCNIFFLVVLFCASCSKSEDEIIIEPPTPVIVGNKYFVSTTGNDTNSGSVSAPFATINKAAEIAMAGDSICIKNGTYIQSSIIKPANSGVANGPITYYAETPNAVIINGQSTIPTIASREGLIHILGKSHLVFNGLRIINSGFFGILAKDNSSFITVKNCSTFNTGASGICAAQSSNIKVLNNSVQRACIAPGGSSVRTSECITMASVNTFEVANNIVFDRLTDPNDGGEGIDCKNLCSNGIVRNNTVYDLYRVGIYIDAYAMAQSNIEVFANKVYNCGSGINLACETGGTNTNIKVHDNLFYNCSRIGIRIAGYLSDGAMYNISIYNNTVNNCGWGTTSTWENCGLLVEANNSLNQNIVVRNNIFSNNKIQMKTKRPGQAQSWLTLDNNLIFGANDASASGTNATNTIVGNPMFVNSTTNDFRITATSPAIDKAIGSPLSFFDFANTARPFDGDANGSAISDIGAFEFK